MSDSISKDVQQYIGENDLFSTDFENSTILSINFTKIKRSLISKDVIQYMKEKISILQILKKQQLYIIPGCQ